MSQTNPETVPLPHGLTAIVITHAEIAAQQQLELEKPTTTARNQ
jgi:hypothetical protein